MEDKRELYIKEILEYQDILSLQIKRENEIVCAFGGLSEKEQVYEDINSYVYTDFLQVSENEGYNWVEEDFIDYILYLQDLTQITNKLGLNRSE